MGNKNGVPILTKEDIRSLVTTTGLNEEEVGIAFDQFLTNHPSGHLTRKDFSLMIQKLLPRKAAAKMSDHLFRIYDKDNDGKIDFVEFFSVYQIMAKGSSEQVLKQIFHVFDTNQDGIINPKEMKRIVKDMMMLINDDNSLEDEDDDNPGHASRDTIAQNAFLEMDKNSNGTITVDEFISACLNQDSFTKMLALKIIDIFVDDE